MAIYLDYWEKHPEVSEMKLLQDKGMKPHLQENVTVLEQSSSSEEAAALGPSTNRFNVLLTISDDEES